MRRFIFLFFFAPISVFAESGDSLLSTLSERIAEEPFRLFTAIMFFGAVLHTFLASKFVAISNKVKRKHYEETRGELMHSAKAEFFHLLGEVEAIFAIWIIPLIVGFIISKGWHSTVEYFETRHYTEPIFVVVIMTIAASRPILIFSETMLSFVVKLFGKGKPSYWWFAILAFAPILGSFITEPAAMTIAALLLAKHIYELKPSAAFSYATLGLLFVNISVGGALTNFAAPPVLMVAAKWGWSSKFMFLHFGLEAIIGIFLGTIFYLLIFSKELKRLNEVAKGVDKQHVAESVPASIIFAHIGFLLWTVVNAHNVPFLIWGFLLFMAFTSITSNHQSKISIKGPLLVGCFLAGLVTHGGLQEWWIQAVLTRLGDSALFFGSVFLTSFNDNAAITYLASLVEEFQSNFQLQYAVVSGAIVGGGLTVIANAPNPAGQSILSKFFTNGVIKPINLLLGATIPTIMMVVSFRVIGKMLS